MKSHFLLSLQTVVAALFFSMSHLTASALPSVLTLKWLPRHLPETVGHDNLKKKHPSRANTSAGLQEGI